MMPPALDRLEQYAPRAIDDIIRLTLYHSPHSPAALLTQLGRSVHESAKRVLYADQRIILPALAWGCDKMSEGETREEWRDRRKWETVLQSPSRYAHCVRSISVYPPSRPNSFPSGIGATSVGQGEDEILVTLLHVCAQTLDRFEWRGIGVWGDGVGEILIDLPALQHLALMPPPLHPSSTSTQHSVSSIPRFNLPHLLPQTLRSLDISRLSAFGAKNLSLHFSTLPPHAPLDRVAVESPSLDDALADLISEAGRGVRDVWLRSSGSKFTDKGLLRLFEGCVELEKLTLSELQGRLSRNVWAKVEEFPASFKHLRIEISDVGPHHSWVQDHLSSIHHAPVSQLVSFSVTRSTPPFALLPVPPLGHLPPAIDETCALRPIPSDLVDALIQGGKRLKTLEIDWWEISVEDWTKIAKVCVGIERLKLTLDASFAKLLSMTTPFSHMTSLHTLHVSIPPRHIPPPGLIPPTTPISSPSALKSSPLGLHPTSNPNPSPPYSHSDLHHNHDPYDPSTTLLHPLLLAKSNDPTLPASKEIKKFVRRVPKLTELGWVGRDGVGRWLIAREPVGGDEGGKGGTGGVGKKIGANKGVVKMNEDIEFRSFAVEWRAEWEEAGKGAPAWKIEGGGGVGAGGGTSPARERLMSLDGTGAGGGRERSVSGSSVGGGAGEARNGTKRRQSSVSSMTSLNHANGHDHRRQSTTSSSSISSASSPSATTGALLSMSPVNQTSSTHSHLQLDLGGKPSHPSSSHSSSHVGKGRRTSSNGGSGGGGSKTIISGESALGLSASPPLPTSKPVLVSSPPSAPPAPTPTLNGTITSPKSTKRPAIPAEHLPSQSTRGGNGRRKSSAPTGSPITAEEATSMGTVRAQQQREPTYRDRAVSASAGTIGKAAAVGGGGGGEGGGKKVSGGGAVGAGGSGVEKKADVVGAIGSGRRKSGGGK